MAFDSFSEGKHPRDNAGQFTESGGGSGQSKPMKSKAAFVNEFMHTSTNREEDMTRLGKLPDEKLRAALKVLTDNRVNDEDAVYMKELIRDVLKASK